MSPSLRNHAAKQASRASREAKDKQTAALKKERDAAIRRAEEESASRMAAECDLQSAGVDIDDGLREAVATVIKERDAARAEVEALREATDCGDWADDEHACGKCLRCVGISLEESNATRDRMRAILVGVARALKGEPAPGVQHDWSDLAEVATRMVTAGRNMAVCLDRFREEHDEEFNRKCACARCQKAEKYSSDFRALLPQPQAAQPQKPLLLCTICGQDENADVHMDGTDGPDNAHEPRFKCVVCGDEWLWSEAECQKCKTQPQAAKERRNQCDGCARGLPVDANGIHHDEQTFGMACTANRYAADNERMRELEEALSHMRWCATCAEDGWDHCEEGRKADALLKPQAATQAKEREP